MKVKLIGLIDIQILGVGEIAALLDIELSDDGIPIHFLKKGTAIHLQYDGKTAVIMYKEQHQIYRALGLLIERIKKGEAFELKESPVYESLGIMIDCSRNAVLTVKAFKKMIRHLALMGYTAVQLYTEDTYEIESYPYFGYMRGRYNKEELKTMDQYAKIFGIELIPCIQTLAHLGSVLKWEVFSEVLDCNDILLIDEERTYQLIEAMFRTMASNLTSRKINIGMDEAHMMGLGKYLDKHGYQERSSLMLKHFERVIEIARKYGYEPMMWSDMFFRLASSGDYYDANSPIRQDVIEMIPDDVSLVYWDYYSVELEKYDAMLKKHKQLSERIIFAGGAWKWMGFSPNNQFSKYTGEMAHDSCVNNGIKEVLITAWGDNGAEASIYSILPTLQFWAELCYSNNKDKCYLKERFKTCTGGDYDDFMHLDKLMQPLSNNNLDDTYLHNPSKYLLYQDILCGLFDKHLIPKVYTEHFHNCTEIFEDCIRRNPKWKEIFQSQYALSRVLELKCSVGISIRNAYLNKDKEKLKKYSNLILPKLKERVKAFIDVYHIQWMTENKIFGLDVFDIRIGGLLQRIDTAINRINAYVKGEIIVIEELEEEILSFDGRENDKESRATTANLWHNIATASVLNGI
ncbi:family 20 glycosylhydrolase [Metabacillus fastidiosus]|uniref:family 20 glycosylhydrolase n=1 Tax=Metabacillus fastidiosus TaxID=1458 RepID=UPI002E2006C8|nr:family 20 glycosylhydrolase [Metabacillus fastidiosus]MED4534392.1 family 20 glycosylhydrolase [Metabacillus fastidiosus]